MAKINVDLIYPIGSIYININNTNPSIFFGGTWEQIQARYLMGAGRPSKNNYDGFGQITDEQIAQIDFSPATLGELTHSLTVNEIPSHRHDGLYWYTIPITYDGGSGGWYPGQGGADSSTAGAMHTGFTGGGQAHNNLPPTLIVYIWKRIA